jgi:hypothetical protein
MAPPGHDNASAIQTFRAAEQNARKRAQQAGDFLLPVQYWTDSRHNFGSTGVGDEIASSSPFVNCGVPRKGSDPSPFGIYELERPPDLFARPED